jgi:hypothetical protein
VTGPRALSRRTSGRGRCSPGDPSATAPQTQKQIKRIDSRAFETVDIARRLEDDESVGLDEWLARTYGMRDLRRSTRSASA